MGPVDEATDLANGGPLDGAFLGSAGPEKYDVRMADGTCHVYRRPEQRSDGARLYQYEGRR